MRLRRYEAHLVVHTQLIDQGVQRGHLTVAVLATGTADDQQQRIGAVELRQRPHRDIGCLQGLDATDEEQHRCVQRQIERTTRAAALAGREERVLDAGCDDLDATLRVAVEPAELAFLFGAADADGVGTADDLVLGAMPPLRFEVAALRFHLGQRVERADERDVQLVLDAVRNQATEEVVGVDDIRRRVVLEVVDHQIAELGEDARQLLLRQVERAGRYVDHPMPRLDQHDLRLVGVRAARVSGAFHAGVRESRDKLAHVHVHTATVARTRLGEGRRVEREHCQALHDGWKHYPFGRHSGFASPGVVEGPVADSPREAAEEEAIAAGARFGTTARLLADRSRGRCAAGGGRRGCPRVGQLAMVGFLQPPVGQQSNGEHRGARTVPRLASLGERRAHGHLLPRRRVGDQT